MKHIKPYKIFESNSPNFPTTREEVIQVCEKYNIKNYTINDDLSIDVDGDVFLDRVGLQSLSLRLEYLPLRFNYVSGSFYCYENDLVSLEGCPHTVGGNFDCYNNKLKDLEYFPEVNGIISMRGNPVDLLVYTFIEKANSFMIEDFNDYEVVRNRDTVMLDRLQTFIRDNDLKMPDLEEIKKHYKIIE